MTIQELAQQMLDQMVSRRRDNGDEFVCFKSVNAPDWMREIVRKAHGDGMPDDTVYELVQRSLETIVDTSEGSEEDAAYDIEADVYTHDLTGWLHANVNHVFYLSECLEEGDYKDGFQLLQAAQIRQREEIYLSVLDGLRNHVAEEEEEYVGE